MADQWRAKALADSETKVALLEAALQAEKQRADRLERESLAATRSRYNEALRARAETAEAKLETARRLLDHYTVRSTFDVAYEEKLLRKTAEAKLAELVEWRRGLTQVEAGIVYHYTSTGMAQHSEDLPWCTVVYPDGTTECDWLEANKGEQG